MMKQNPFFQKTAQTASELAVFGAVFIFVLGLIIRYAVNFNYFQNQSLVAMRLAMQQSFLTSESGSNARNFASVLFIEDRKDPTGDRYGAMSRNPYIVSGSGAFTKNLFMGTDWGVQGNIPLTDIFINGKHFSFTTAAFKIYYLDQNPHDESGNPIPVDWETDPNKCPHDPGNVRDGGPPPAGCPIIYTRVPRIPSITSGRFDSSKTERFNLDRCANTQCSTCATGLEVPDALQDEFSWQWYPVYATSKTLAIAEGSSVSYDVDGDLKEEQILKVYANDDAFYSLGGEPSASGQVSRCKPTQIAATEIWVIDQQEGDLDLTINTADEMGKPNPANGCTDVLAQDRKPRPGLQNESIFYAGYPLAATESTGPHAYFTIEEGKLYENVPGLEGKQFIRNATKRDRVDIIERRIQLSNDTGRICGNGGGGWDVPDGMPNRGQNPSIDVCVKSTPGAPGTPGSSKCREVANMFQTCFDECPAGCPDSLVLFVRSRLGDLTGRKWITDVDSDEMPLR